MEKLSTFSLFIRKRVYFASPKAQNTVFSMIRKALVSYKKGSRKGLALGRRSPAGSTLKIHI